jgi:hypothetical protein
MQAYRRFSNLSQLAAGLGVFAALALLLDSGGLYDWARDLELGPERTIALPAVTTIHVALAHLGIENGREQLLAGLAHIGWSDDNSEMANASTTRSASDGTAAHGPSVASGPTPLIKPKTSIPKFPRLPLAGAPPLNSALPAIPGVVAGRQRTVALAGDSMMAVGIASTILRQAQHYKSLTFISVFKSGTGLARPEVFNWQTQYPVMLKSAKPEVILVAIGANDGQGFVDDGVTYPFGSEGWQRIYQVRVETYLQMLQSDGATVVWIGLPPMKSDKYNAKIALVNRVAYTVVSSTPRAIWFSSGGTVGDADGQFRDFGEVSNHTVRLRQNDGIHLSDDGATLLAAKLLPWLAKEDEESVKALAAEALDKAASTP